ncbi:MAG: imidazolonepropionase [Clostridiales bacterium]|nr:imidazolonepropionase [Clostridiales bacterium]
MSKRKWTNVEVLGAEINAMREAGKTRQEIADYFGLDKVQIKNWVNRYNKEVKGTAQGITPRPKGRPRKDGQWPHQNEKTELERLQMENKLLRDFLQFIGRK